MPRKMWSDDEDQLVHHGRADGLTMPEVQGALLAAGHTRTLKAIEERWRRIRKTVVPISDAPAPDELLGLLLRGPVEATKDNLDAARALLALGHMVDVDLGGNEIALSRHVERGESPVLADEIGNGQEITIGLISDTHHGSKYRDIELLSYVLPELERRGAQIIYHAGDLFDGNRMYRGHEFELEAIGADAQYEMAVKEHPALGIRQKILGGNHDESFIKQIGLDNVSRFCDFRDDCDFIGYHAADIQITDTARMVLMHPTGGVSYAISYKLQKFIEKEVPRPAIFACGHFHVACFFPYTGTLGIMIPTFQTQTPYLRQKALSPILGAVLLRLRISDSGKLSDVWWEWMAAA